ARSPAESFPPVFRVKISAWRYGRRSRYLSKSLIEVVAVALAERIPRRPIIGALAVRRGDDADHGGAIGIAADIGLAALLRRQFLFRQVRPGPGDDDVEQAR